MSAYSGYSDPKIANATNDTAVPEAPRDFQVVSVGLQTTGAPDEKASFVFKFVKPTRSILTIEEAKNDDVYIVTPAGAISGNPAAGATSVSTASDMTGTIAISALISFGTAYTTERYSVAAITSATISLNWGLIRAFSAGEAINLCSPKTAESGTASRTLLVNTPAGTLADIFYTNSAGSTYHWQSTTVLGTLEDKNKIQVPLTATAVLSKRLDISGVTTAVLNSANTTVIATSASLTASLTTSDQIFFGLRGNVKYTIQAITSAAITLTTGLSSYIYPSTSIYKYEGAGTDITDYSALGLAGFTGSIPDATIKKYNLYSRESAQSQGVLGDLRLTISEGDAAGITVYGTGYIQIQYDATLAYFDGRKLYWGVEALDGDDNTGLADINAWAISYPGQVHITGLTVNQSTLAVALTYDNITATGNNPSLLAAMTAVTGGYKVYRKLATAIDFTNGYYSSSSATTGTVYDSEIAVGDILYIKDIYRGNKWTTTATVAGQATISDTEMYFGTTGLSYLTAFTSSSLSIKKATIVIATDDVLGTGVFLDDTASSYASSVPTVDDYAFVMDSYDPDGGTFGKV